MYPYLVADLGGTNARFALVTGKENNDFKLEHIKIFAAANFTQFEDALSHYLAGLDGVTPGAACVAIAGPVTGDQIKMTNLSWQFSCAEIAKKFQLQRFIAINDFAAVAAACGYLGDDHLFCVKPGSAITGMPRAVFGPGTGLGVAGLVPHAEHWLAVPCEGGHVNIAPATELEADLIKTAWNTTEHISAEWLISGPGMVNLYNTLCQMQDVNPQTYKPADITSLAIAGEDDQCRSTLELFCSLAGSFAGNLALTYGAKGGIYIAGGIFPRIKDFLASSQFTQRFQSKGVMSPFVESIPVHLITHKETAFFGAAATLEQALTPVAVM